MFMFLHVSLMCLSSVISYSMFCPFPINANRSTNSLIIPLFAALSKSVEDRCAIFVGPYGGYLVPTNSTVKPSKNVEEELTPASTVSAISTNGRRERMNGDGGHASAVTLPYAAQENLELLTPGLVEGCLDSSFKGGDILGQHPSTGEDVRISPLLR